MIKFRFLIVSEDFPPEVGGCASRAYDFASNAKNPVVITRKTEKKKFPFRVHYFARSFKNPLEILLLPSFAFRFRRIVREGGIDVVFVTSPPITLAFFTILLAKMSGKKVVLDMRDMWYAQLGTHTRLKPIVWFVRSLERYCVKKADQVAVIQTLKSEFMGYGDKIVLAPNAAKLGEIARIKAKKYGNLVTFIGRFYKSRDFSYLLQNRGLLRERFPDLKFLFVGDGPRKKELLSEGFEVRGPVDRKKAWVLMKESLAGIVPLAKKEGNRYQIPLKVYEYIAAGTPIIAWGPEGELRKFVIKNRVGVWVDSEGELPSAVERVRKNRTMYRKNCLKTSKRYDRDRIFKKVIREVTK